jgi:hypothetical protein
MGFILGMEKSKSEKWMAILGVPASLLVLAVVSAVTAFSASASGGRAEGTADGGTEQGRTGISGGCGMIKKGMPAKQAVTVLTAAGVKNIRVHSRESSLTVVAGDSMQCLLLFGQSGFDTEIGFGHILSSWADPARYALGIMKNRHIFVTAEGFEFMIEDGKSVPGVVMITREGSKLHTFKIDVSKAAEVYGGYIEPMLIEKHDLNQVILHAKDADGNDWPRAYIFDGATGKLKGETEWEKVKPGSNP